jgi:hypothetical protein
MGNLAEPTLPAGSVHIQECNNLAALNGFAINVANFPAGFQNTPDGKMPWYERVGGFGKMSLQQVNVGAANFGQKHLQQNPAVLKRGHF